MDKVIVFGATTSAMYVYEKIVIDYDIIAFADNDVKKQNTQLMGKPVIPPNTIENYEINQIIIVSLSSANVIKKQLIDMGIPEYKINISYIENSINARKQFLIDFSKIVYQRDLEGSVAEAGVFQGEYAKYINKAFPDRKLYLFDTFEGFDKKDTDIEKINGFSDAQEGYLNITSQDIVMQKMQYPKNCVIKKGYFPESANGIDDKFVFVNLDLDLYMPTKNGLRYFYEKMTKGGIIIIHDYFSDGYYGVNKAVDEFIDEYNGEIYSFPIGDGISIAIQKL